MTPELIDLARRAMALEGAPLGALWRLGLVRHDDTGNVIVDLADTGADGWALGGVLLGALGVLADLVYTDAGVWHYNVKRSNGGNGWEPAATLAEACCRVAVDYVRWLGPA